MKHTGCNMFVPCIYNGLPMVMKPEVAYIKFISDFEIMTRFQYSRDLSITLNRCTHLNYGMLLLLYCLSGKALLYFAHNGPHKN